MFIGKDRIESQERRWALGFGVGSGGIVSLQTFIYIVSFKIKTNLVVVC